MSASSFLRLTRLVDRICGRLAAREESAYQKRPLSWGRKRNFQASRTLDRSPIDAAYRRRAAGIRQAVARMPTRPCDLRKTEDEGYIRAVTGE